jgi:ankyrin repeat protein/DNA-binding Xre family transcriptional regulator
MDEDIRQAVYNLDINTLQRYIDMISPDDIPDLLSLLVTLPYTPQWDQIFYLLVEIGYRPDTYIPKSGESLLHLAIRSGYISVIDRLLQVFPDLIDTMDNTGFTPLHLAVHMLRPDIVELLLSYGADINSTGGLGIKPLALAISHPNNNEIVDLLLNYGADIYSVDNIDNTILHILLPVPELLSSYLTYIAKYYNLTPEALTDKLIYTPNYYEITPYHVAVYYNIHNIINTYINNNIVNQRDRFGRTALFYTRDSSVASKLLMYTNNVNIIDNYGNTLSSYITSLGDYNVIKDFIDKGGILSQDDVDRIPKDDVRDMIIMYYNSKLNIKPVERWKAICDENLTDQIGLLRDAIRILLSDEEVKKYDTLDKICKFLRSDRFNELFERYRNEFPQMLGSTNVDTIAGYDLWEYKPEYLFPVDIEGTNAKYYFSADYIVKDIIKHPNKDDQGNYIINNPYTNTHIKISKDQYQRLLNITKDDKIGRNALSLIMDMVYPGGKSVLQNYPRYVPYLRRYNEETNNSLNETFILNLAESRNYYNIYLFLEYLMDRTNAILNRDMLNSIANDVQFGTVSDIIIDIINSLYNMRDSVDHQNEFDVAVRFYSNYII